MSKKLVNTMATNLKKAGVITRVTPWMNEEEGEVRYVGVRLEDWDAIFAPSNNILLKFCVDNKQARIDVLLANKPPFVLLGRKNLVNGDTWERVLGTVKQRLNKDKQEYLGGSAKIDNMYRKIVGQLKK